MNNQTDKKEKITLEAKPRETTGKAVRSLRKDGFIPANIYGPNFTSQSITLEWQNFHDTFKKAGETGVIYISVDGKSVPTLITDIQYHPVEETVLHVDFRKVNLKQKIEAHVPVSFVGESEAVQQKNGVLLTQTDSIVVEALPTDIPDHIEVDLSKLVEIGDAITVADLAKSETYEIKDDPEKLIVSVTEHKEEELEPDTTAAAPEITEGAGEELAEGEAPAEDTAAPEGEEKGE